jgi:hypothetical protein
VSGGDFPHRMILLALVTIGNLENVVIIQPITAAMGTIDILSRDANYYGCSLVLAVMGWLTGFGSNERPGQPRVLPGAVRTL